MKRPAWLTRPVLAWSLYDVATSMWVAVIPTVLFALYFRSVVVTDPGRADAKWGLAAAAAVLVSGIISPWIGARADLHGSRRAWLTLATAACCAATVAMAFVGPGQVLAAAAVLVVAQAGYTVAMALYDAYLTRIAVPDNVSRVSSFGFSAGFVGGVAVVLVCMALLHGVDVSQDARFISSFVIVAAMFAAAAVPALLGLRGLDDMEAGAPRGRPARSAARRVAQSIRAWRDHRNAIKFLAALYLINDALVTIAFFVGIYFREQYGIGLTGLLELVLFYQVLAIPCTLAFGRFADRVSPHAAIYTSLAIWIAAVLLMAFGSGPYVPFIVVALFAMVFGSTQALMRGMYALLVPKGQAGEFFGFNALAGRLSAAAGPLLYGLVSMATQSPRAALLSVLVFLIGGALVLATVRIESPETSAEPQGVQ
jgi:UMF1 family MFS transporter